MISEDKRDQLEAEYEMPVERLMYHLYHEQGMSAGEIADELSDVLEDGAHRNTVKYWLRQSGIQMRSRQLSDVQRILMLAYFDANFGLSSIAARLDCGEETVKRYRKDIESELEPADLDGWVSADDYRLLVDIVDDTFGPIDGEAP